MTVRPKLLFRVDGGRVWGVSMGHLHRALLLSRSLKERFEIVFLMKSYVEGVAHAVDSGVRVETIAQDDDSDETLIDSCRRHRPVAVFIDLFSCPYEAFFNYAREKNIATLVLDIRGRVAGLPDAIVNDSFVPQLHRHFRGGEHTAVYSGPAYFIMDTPPVTALPLPVIKRVMITMGGSDPAGVTAGVCGAAAGWEGTLQILVVLGPAFGKDDEVAAAVKDRPWMTVVRNPPDFLGLLARQDLVITSAGRTLYECAALGRPVITVATIAHEALTAAEFSRLTASIDIGEWDPANGPTRLLTALEAYRKGADLRLRVHRAGRRLVDGLGLQRVVAILETLLERSAGPGSLAGPKGSGLP